MGSGRRRACCTHGGLTPRRLLTPPDAPGWCQLVCLLRFKRTSNDTSPVHDVAARLQLVLPDQLARRCCRRRRRPASTVRILSCKRRMKRPQPLQRRRRHVSNFHIPCGICGRKIQRFSILSCRKPMAMLTLHSHRPCAALRMARCCMRHPPNWLGAHDGDSC